VLAPNDKQHLPSRLEEVAVRVLFPGAFADDPIEEIINRAIPYAPDDVCLVQLVEINLGKVLVVWLGRVRQIT
jgi:hypothetical protein